jgi:hypothetical protein
MQQKTTWMLYLSFGISIIIQTNSCKKDYSLKEEWIFINETDSTISYFPSRNELNIPPNGTIIYNTNEDAGKDVAVEDLSSPINADIIYYGLTMCDTLKNSQEGPLNIKNYNTEKLGRNNFKHTYRYTKTMMLKADICK